VAEDDWRVTVTLAEGAQVGRLRQLLQEHEVETEVRERLGDRVVVGEGDGVVFLYTTTREAAREAERVVGEILSALGVDGDVAVDRWHPIEERWEDERVPLPTSGAERQVEHERLEQDEVAESERLGAALWEVRVELESHRDAVALAERLRAERDSLVPGWTFSVGRRWKYLLIGAGSEDQAHEIAERLEGMLPAGASIEVEPSGALARPTFNPFAVFGGLGT
jgi:hypothetical protein